MSKQLLTAFLLLSAPTVFAGEQELERPLNAREVFQSLREGTKRFGPGGELARKVVKEAPALFGRMDQDINFLAGFQQKREMPQGYLATLRNDADLLLAINVREVKPQDGTTVADVASDLRAKTKHAASNAKEPYKVTVVVDTKSEDMHLVPGLEVWYVQNGRLLDTRRYKSFPQRSTPSRFDLTPGNWVFWSQDPGNNTKRGVPKQVPVFDTTGKGECPVDILPPKP